MNEKEFSDKVKWEAINHGLCDMWQNSWGNPATVDDMLKKFVNGQEFCIREKWPTKEFLKEYASEKLHSYGIYIDESFTVSNIQTLILMGACDCVLTIDGNNSCIVYVRDMSRLTINASGESIVIVKAYDNSTVIKNASGKSRVFSFGNITESVPMVNKEE